MREEKVKMHRIPNMGPDDPWPDLITVKGKPYWLHVTKVSPTLAMYESAREKCSNWGDFIAWCQVVNTLLDRCQHFIVQYEGEDGESIHVARYPDFKGVVVTHG